VHGHHPEPRPSLGDGYRQEEISHSPERILRSDWADTRNIFLIEHSEGGQATARSKHDAWSAQAISGWTCTVNRKLELSGIHSPTHIPVLAVAYLDDGWRRAGESKGRYID
jgi:hypothetical protein